MRRNQAHKDHEKIEILLFVIIFFGFLLFVPLYFGCPLQGGCTP